MFRNRDRLVKIIVWVVVLMMVLAVLAVLSPAFT
jgi:hypothetical protein